jgi:anti-sigma factor RsiW
MMCPYQDDLTAFVDRELPVLRFHEMTEHLSTCDACRGIESLLRRTVAQLHALPAYEPSPLMRQAVMKRLESRKQPSWFESLLSPRRLVPALVAVTAAAVVLVFSRRETRLDLTDHRDFEIAQNMEMVEDYELLGLQTPEDIEAVQQLHELEVQR